VGLAYAAIWYEAEIRRRRDRIPERMLYPADVPVIIPEAPPSEVSIAYRVGGSEKPIEILSIANALWWPLRLPKLGRGHLTESNLAEMLKNSSINLLGLSCCSELPIAPRPLEQDPTIRQVFTDHREEVSIAAQRKISETLLIVAGRVYVRGGPPVCITAANRFLDPGAGRFIDHRLDGIRFHSLLDLDDATSSALRRGAVRILRGADRLDNVTSKAGCLTAAELRVDACLRDLWLFLNGSIEFFVENENVRLLKAHVAQLASEPPASDRLTATFERLGALHRLVALADDWPEFSRSVLAQDIRKATRELADYNNGAGVNRKRRLSRVDDDAIGRLCDLLAVRREITSPAAICRGNE
jgi:hypothetical protein